MRLALAVGRRNLGATWPNPSVGAVVVEPRSGRILAQAATASGGRPHAEPTALAMAGADARGATLYVSLEPCAHHGRTPPCADAIVAAGLARVVSAMADPDPRVADRGHARLRSGGIVVETGVLAEAARRDHLGHVTRVVRKRPALHLKLAQTADGYGGRAGERLLITGEGANARTHLMRAHADAVLVGIGTVLADDPRLDVRLPGLEVRSPVRIVVDRRLRLRARARVLTGDGRTWVVCADDADIAAERSLRDAGAEIIRVAAGPNGRWRLGAALTALAERGLTRVLCEGGPSLAEALARDDLLDEVTVITAALRLDKLGVHALRPGLAARLDESFQLVGRDVVGPDRLDRYERKPCSPGS